MKWSREEDRAFLRTLPPDAPALRDMPELWPECEAYLQSFFDLSPTRPVSMGAIGFIPLAEVVAYAAIAEIEDVMTLFRHVRALDQVFVAVWREERERDEQSRRPHQRQ